MRSTAVFGGEGCAGAAAGGRECFKSMFWLHLSDASCDIVLIFAWMIRAKFTWPSMCAMQLPSRRFIARQLNDIGICGKSTAKGKNGILSIEISRREPKEYLRIVDLSATTLILVSIAPVTIDSSTLKNVWSPEANIIVARLPYCGPMPLQIKWGKKEYDRLRFYKLVQFTYETCPGVQFHKNRCLIIAKFDTSACASPPSFAAFSAARLNSSRKLTLCCISCGKRPNWPRA